LEELEIPTIAAVHGFAFGMGCEIALGCDFRIATESAQFGLPEIKLGLIPGGGGSQRLTRLIGATKALEMAMIGDPIDAQEAYRLGIVNKVVPDNQLMEEVDKLAKKIIRLGKIAVSSVKAAIYKCLSTGIYDGIECELDKFSLILATEDATEGTTAFLEKRRPEFKGK
jgi:enoyl-CoA hydratase/carnithine racemase